MIGLPSGTVTFLFTDVEGSTLLWERDPDAARAAMRLHVEICEDEVARAGGAIFKTTGDGVCAAFPRASQAVEAALAIQSRLADGGPAVRVALYTGSAEPRGGDYMGPALNRTARLLEAAHGRQVVLSLATEELARDELPNGASLHDLGWHRLRDLSHPEQVFQLVHPAIPADFPGLRSLETRPHNLPVQLTSFVGRERELAEVERLLEGTRLLTLVGVGGSGKTRLGLQAAARALERFRDGVWVVELARLVDPELVPQTVAATLGIPEQPGRPLMDVLGDALSGRSLLLLLDNCEHLIAAAAWLADRLLHAAPALVILATSREGLGIAGETLYQVPPLEASSEAVELFLERARAVRPDYEPDGDAGLVADICDRLDGMPLAIELAAARVRAMSVAQIATRLEDRFRFLTGGSRTALPRQQTLEATVDWSYELLSQDEQLLFRRVAVFAGDFSLEAAEDVCGGKPLHRSDVLDLLTHLVDKSLVATAAGRYRMLETIRSYARAKLAHSGEGDHIRQQHARHYRELMVEAERSRLPDMEFFDLAQTERDNLRAAFQWLETSGRLEEAAELTLAMRLFWVGRAVSEGRQWAERLVAQPGLETSALARVRALLAYCTGLQGELESALEIADRALEEARQAGDRSAVALALEVVASFDRHDPVRARAAGEEALEIYESMADTLQLARIQFAMGLSAKYRGDYEEAVEWMEKALGHLRKGGHSWHVAWGLVNMAQLTRYLGHLDRAGAIIGEALDLMRQTGDARGTAAAETEMARFLWDAGRRSDARAAIRRGLSLAKEVGSHIEAARALDVLGWITAQVGQPGRAVRLFGAAEGLVALPGRWPPADQAWLEEAVAAVRGELGDAFHEAWSKGEDSALDEAVSYALEDL